MESKLGKFEQKYKKIVEIYQDYKTPLKMFMAQVHTDSLVLFGCGSVCRNIILVCRDLHIEIKALCDTYKTGFFEDTGLEIISPDKLKEKYPNANVIICSYLFADEISRKLDDLGFSKMQITRVPMNILDAMHPSEFARRYLTGYEWAYNFFSDNVSKDIVIDRMNLYINGVRLTRTSDAPQYFDNEIIRFNKDEVFVDGGAFTGDTAEEFIRQCKKHGVEYRHIYSFEPDDNARQRAICNLKKYGNTDIIGKGLWSCDTNLKFYNDGGCQNSSFTYGIRTISVPVTSIDYLFADKSVDEWPTFIKMDIEGSEKEALIGAKNVIGRKHPKLAICVYHKQEDIYELPKLIYAIDPSYKFTLRQCKDGFYETLLYAI